MECFKEFTEVRKNIKVRKSPNLFFFATKRNCFVFLFSRSRRSSRPSFSIWPRENHRHCRNDRRNEKILGNLFEKRCRFETFVFLPFERFLLFRTFVHNLCFSPNSMQRIQRTKSRRNSSRNPRFGREKPGENRVDR